MFLQRISPEVFGLRCVASFLDAHRGQAMFIRPAAKRIFLFSLFVVALAISALGQSNKATIVGTTKDPNDALVTGAKVTIINNATGVVREAESGEDGTCLLYTSDAADERSS